MRFLLFTSFVCFLAISGVAQNFEDGFIIDKNGRYIYGQIVVSETDVNYEQCSFKESTRSEIEIFTVEEIAGFGTLSGIKYIRKEIEVENKTVQVFIKKEFEGLTKLYTYKSRIFIDYNSFNELKKNSYHSDLQTILGKCNNIDRAIKGTDFSVRGIKKLLERYEVCSGADFLLPKKVLLNAELLSGLEFNKVTLNSSDPELGFLNDQPLIDKTLFVVGARLNFSLPSVKNLSLSTGVLFYDQDMYQIIRSTDGNTVDKVTLDYLEFQVPVNFQYNLLGKKNSILPYLRSGISFSIYKNPRMTWEHEEGSNDVIYFYSYDDFLNNFKSNIHFDLALGTRLLILKKINSLLELQLNTGSSSLTTFEDKELSSKDTRISVLLGIRF